MLNHADLQRAENEFCRKFVQLSLKEHLNREAKEVSVASRDESKTSSGALTVARLAEESRQLAETIVGNFIYPGHNFDVVQILFSFFNQILQKAPSTCETEQQVDDLFEIFKMFICCISWISIKPDLPNGNRQDLCPKIEECAMNLANNIRVSQDLIGKEDAFEEKKFIQQMEFLINSHYTENLLKFCKRLIEELDLQEMAKLVKRTELKAKQAAEAAKKSKALFTNLTNMRMEEFKMIPGIPKPVAPTAPQVEQATENSQQAIQPSQEQASNTDQQSSAKAGEPDVRLGREQLFQQLKTNCLEKENKSKLNTKVIDLKAAKETVVTGGSSRMSQLALMRQPSTGTKLFVSQKDPRRSMLKPQFANQLVNVKKPQTGQNNPSKSNNEFVTCHYDHSSDDDRDDYENAKEESPSNQQQSNSVNASHNFFHHSQEETVDLPLNNFRKHASTHLPMNEEKIENVRVPEARSSRKTRKTSWNESVLAFGTPEASKSHSPIPSKPKLHEGALIKPSNLNFS